MLRQFPPDAPIHTLTKCAMRKPKAVLRWLLVGAGARHVHSAHKRDCKRIALHMLVFTCCDVRANFLSQLLVSGGQLQVYTITGSATLAGSSGDYVWSCRRHYR